MLNRPVLLLNQNYEPLSVCRIRRALILMLSHKAEPVETSEFAVHSVNFTIPVPSVLRLNYYVQIRRREVPLTKRNILRRDNYTCQYCGVRKPVMTTDHVIPKALGGTDSWENMVCACSECNARKENRTPAQANMKLRRKPKTPHYITFAVNALEEIPEAWRQYLFLS
ncbi:MAG: HNH endonuclease [candidate division WOR-3 bacterium]